MTRSIKDEQDVDKVLEENPGRWIAWNLKKTKIFAIADSYPEVMQMLEELKIPDDDAWVDRASGYSPEMIARASIIFPDESPNVLDDIMKIVPNPERWLDTPNENLWDKKPRELLGTSDEIQIREMLRAYRSGIFS